MSYSWDKRKDITHLPAVKVLVDILVAEKKTAVYLAKKYRLNRETVQTLLRGRSVQLLTFFRVADKLGYEVKLVRKVHNDGLRSETRQGNQSASDLARS